MAKDKDEKKEEAVLSFLIAQNRPFSLNDLLLNQQLKELGKAALQKSLDQLVVVRLLKLVLVFCHVKFTFFCVLGREGQGKD